MLTRTLLLLTFTAIQGILARPYKQAPEQDLRLLFEGNKQFKANIESSNPGLLKKLADEGQGALRVYAFLVRTG